MDHIAYPQSDDDHDGGQWPQESMASPTTLRDYRHDYRNDNGKDVLRREDQRHD
jgi:hypothetical protein